MAASFYHDSGNRASSLGSSTSRAACSEKVRGLSIKEMPEAESCCGFWRHLSRSSSATSRQPSPNGNAVNCRPPPRCRRRQGDLGCLITIEGVAPYWAIGDDARAACRRGAGWHAAMKQPLFMSYVEGTWDGISGEGLMRRRPFFQRRAGEALADPQLQRTSPVCVTSSSACGAAPSMRTKGI